MTIQQSLIKIKLFQEEVANLKSMIGLFQDMANRFEDHELTKNNFKALMEKCRSLDKYTQEDSE